MNLKEQRNRIRGAYVDCLLVYRPRQQGWNSLLQAAFEAAQRSERVHRRNRERFTMSVDDCARWFAVKWFLEVHKAPKNWADVCQLRDDCRLARGAAAVCPKEELSNLRRQYADVLAYDYASWAVRS